MYYVIQENVFKETHYNIMIDAMKRFNFDFEIVKFIPFCHDIEFKTERKDVWVWGSVTMSRVAEKYGWSPGSMYNENHDFEVYGKHYGDHMLNSDGVIINFGDELPERFEYFFARPTKDTKVFSGQCFGRDAWVDYQKQIEITNVTTLLNNETKVLIAPLKTTEQEIRCWVVDGKVITASRYKFGSRVIYENYDDETAAIQYAQSVVDIYQPAKAFVLDICLFNGEYKVVEINCINCSGFYHMNVYKLIEALETVFN
jgi:hypothetical protein